MVHEHDQPPVRSLGTFGQSVGNSLLDVRLREVGGICRCLACCCPEGRGHKHPRWIAYEAEQREEEAAADRYEQAKRDGLSDYEAREEGWPSVCRDDIGWHATPHRGCILR